VSTYCSALGDQTKSESCCSSGRLSFAAALTRGLVGRADILYRGGSIAMVAVFTRGTNFDKSGLDGLDGS
jgi:hypothetical protein